MKSCLVNDFGENQSLGESGIFKLLHNLSEESTRLTKYTKHQKNESAPIDWCRIQNKGGSKTWGRERRWLEMINVRIIKNSTNGGNVEPFTTLSKTFLSLIIILQTLLFSSRKRHNHDDGPDCVENFACNCD